MVWKLIPVVLGAVAVAVWYPPWRWYALGWAVPLGLVLLFSAAIWIRKRRNTEADEMDETRELLEDLRDGAAWLFKLWP